MYSIVLKSIKNLLTQQGCYELSLETITMDSEIALINSVNCVFNKVQRIGCWFHMKQDLIRQARIQGLLNSKNKKIDVSLTFEIIYELSILPLTYKGSVEYVKIVVYKLGEKYKLYYNYLNSYF